jgi:hypothetical protein
MGPPPHQRDSRVARQCPKRLVITGPAGPSAFCDTDTGRPDGSLRSAATAARRGAASGAGHRRRRPHKRRSAPPIARCVAECPRGRDRQVPASRVARDAESDLKALRTYLHEKAGLSPDAIEEACEIARREREPGAKDQCGAGHAALAREWREPGEKVFRIADRDSRFEETFSRSSAEGFYEPPELERSLTARDGQITAGAAAAKTVLSELFRT